jgi:lysophospholipase L1-like esterase
MRCLLAWLLTATTLLAAEPASDPSRLTLPPRAFALTGSELGVDFDNLVLTQDPQRYRFVVHSDLGTADAQKWVTTPTAKDVGDHAWRVELFEGDKKVSEKAMTFTVVPAEAAAGKRLRLLIVGDSLTHASLYPNDLAKRLSAAGQPAWTMLGTHKPGGAAPGVAHEGYGGWTWERFVTHYEPAPDLAARKHSSPFVFLTDDKPKLDVARYIREACGGEAPDVVFFLLGINDCFGAKPDDLAAIDQRIDRVFGYADTLLTAFREACPQADLAIGITTPGNSRESSFLANYKGNYTRWGWKRIQHRLVERELEKFSGREAERLFLVPTQLNLDPVAGYPENDSVHPNAQGYRQVAASLHAWLVARAGGVISDGKTPAAK